MKLLKKIEDMKFTKVEEANTFVSEPLAMASAAGWYVGTICKDDLTADFVEPYDRWTDYMTKEQAVEMLKEEWLIY